MSFDFLQYKDKEEVVLWMNTVGPYHNRQETYKYFSLPFCAGSKKTISHYHETLGEALQGVELEFSGLDIKFKGTSSCYTDLDMLRTLTQSWFPAVTGYVSAFHFTLSLCQILFLCLISDPRR